MGRHVGIYCELPNGPLRTKVQRYKSSVRDLQRISGHAVYPQGAVSAVTCSVEVYECLAARVIVETLAAVLLQLNLLYVDTFSDHFTSLSAEEAVSQYAIHCNGPALLSDLVSSLIGRENTAL